MRVIKFRAWDRVQKRMIYEALEIGDVGFGDGSVVINSETQSGNELDWMQLTGLKDKNGKDIYENDWCRACFRDKEGFHYKQGLIIMDEYMWCLHTQDPNDEHYIYSINRLHDWEVLGNAHETPELIETKTKPA